MAINVKDAKEKLGEERVAEIVEKDWKVAELPTDEELASEEHKSPKARNNKNSRKNLVQYRKKSKETKEKIINNLEFPEKEEDVDPSEFVGNSKLLEMVESLVPAKLICSDRSEQELYYNYLKLLLRDFDADDLTASDIDDITTLALNKVLTIRLLKASRKSPKLVLEASPHIEKFNKASEKIKGSLASRRVDRIDVKNRPAFSIVDLAAHLDEAEKLDFERRAEEMEKRREEFKPPRRNEKGLLLDDNDS